MICKFGDVPFGVVVRLEFGARCARAAAPRDRRSSDRQKPGGTSRDERRTQTGSAAPRRGCPLPPRAARRAGRGFLDGLLENRSEKRCVEPLTENGGEHEHRAFVFVEPNGAFAEDVGLQRQWSGVARSRRPSRRRCAPISAKSGLPSESTSMRATVAAPSQRRSRDARRSRGSRCEGSPRSRMPSTRRARDEMAEGRQRGIDAVVDAQRRHEQDARSGDAAQMLRSSSVASRPTASSTTATAACAPPRVPELAAPRRRRRPSRRRWDVVRRISDGGGRAFQCDRRWARTGVRIAHVLAAVAARDERGAGHRRGEPAISIDLPMPASLRPARNARRNTRASANASRMKANSS